MPTKVMVRADDLASVHQNIQDLRPETLVRPRLVEFGQAVVETMVVYPPQGLALLSRAAMRQRRARAKRAGFTGRLSKFDFFRAGTMYHRTGNYGGSWGFETIGNEEQIENLARYAGYVGGLESSPGGGKGQPYTWRYGWKRLRRVAMDELKSFVERLKSYADATWIR